jgi:hypothetical protein
MKVLGRFRGPGQWKEKEGDAAADLAKPGFGLAYAHYVWTCGKLCFLIPSGPGSNSDRISKPCELRGMATRMDEQGSEIERLTQAVA